MPKDGWSDLAIQYLIDRCALMDSNNFEGNCGVGEREGRIISRLVQQRNNGLAHGIGRSGDVNALQPKAIGSSLIVKLTKAMALHCLRKVMSMPFVNELIVLPFATGMSITMTLLTLKAEKPQAKFVIWPRIDQKTCLKAISAANLTPIVIEPTLDGEELQTNLEGVKEALQKYGSEVLAIASTTSCFAPRAIDNVVELAKMAKAADVFHLVNNAYGL
jgi:O-phospho-L-seryl-tRNASec:L-selenocysteinyl-tRNA synthase